MLVRIRALTIKTSFPLRLFAVASPVHLDISLISHVYSSLSTFRPTSSSFSLSFDHCVAFFSFQCQLFGFVAEKHSREEQPDVPISAPTVRTIFDNPAWISLAPLSHGTSL